MLQNPIDTLSISELSLVGAGEGTGKGQGRARDKKTGTTDVIDSASFIALSDDDHQPIPILSPHPFPSTPRSRPLDSLEFMPHSHTPEEDRRRRREKIAKLHRFLGSRVPTSLVLGLSDANDTLPALDTTVGNVHTHHLGRRRSSSATEFKSNWFDPDDRMKEELDEREKAINVRRAVKMEKVNHCGVSFLARASWLSMTVVPGIWRTTPADIVSHSAASKAKGQGRLD